MFCDMTEFEKMRSEEFYDFTSVQVVSSTRYPRMHLSS